jgi:hypothetical protein
MQIFTDVMSFFFPPPPPHSFQMLAPLKGFWRQVPTSRDFMHLPRTALASSLVLLHACPFRICRALPILRRHSGLHSKFWCSSNVRIRPYDITRFPSIWSFIVFPTWPTSLITSFWILSWNVFLTHLWQKPFSLLNNFLWISPFNVDNCSQHADTDSTVEEQIRFVLCSYVHFCFDSVQVNFHST